MWSFHVWNPKYLRSDGDWFALPPQSLLRFIEAVFLCSLFSVCIIKLQLLRKLYYFPFFQGHCHELSKLRSDVLLPEPQIRSRQFPERKTSGQLQDLQPLCWNGLHNPWVWGHKRSGSNPRSQRTNNGSGSKSINPFNSAKLFIVLRTLLIFRWSSFPWTRQVTCQRMRTMW